MFTLAEGDSASPRGFSPIRPDDPQSPPDKATSRSRRASGRYADGDHPAAITEKVQRLGECFGPPKNLEGDVNPSPSRLFEDGLRDIGC
jgi:hypothetical protein